METKSLGLEFVWRLRLKLKAEGDKLMSEGYKLKAEGNELLAEGSKLWVEGYKLIAGGYKFIAEGYKLWVESYKLWAEAIIEVYGNIKIEWKNYNSEKEDWECWLETGEKFIP